MHGYGEFYYNCETNDRDVSVKKYFKKCLSEEKTASQVKLRVTAHARMSSRSILSAQT